jgi:hypothetical protein
VAATLLAVAFGAMSMCPALVAVAWAASVTAASIGLTRITVAGPVSPNSQSN